jgi:hypothetical protein
MSARPGDNRGKWHRKTKRKPRAPKRPNGKGHALSPRLPATSIDEKDLRRLTWLAAKRGKPLASVIRDAVWAYLLPIAADADRDHHLGEQ